MTGRSKSLGSKTLDCPAVIVPVNEVQAVDKAVEIGVSIEIRVSRGQVERTGHSEPLVKVNQVERSVSVHIVGWDIGLIDDVVDRDYRIHRVSLPQIMDIVGIASQPFDLDGTAFAIEPTSQRWQSRCPNRMIGRIDRRGALSQPGGADLARFRGCNAGTIFGLGAFGGGGGALFAVGRGAGVLAGGG